MRKITLVLGGIRSGKSYFAEQRAEFYSERPVYIATGIAFDEEMKARVALHRARRGDRYETIEAPYSITGPLEKLKNRTVLVDCLTLNLSNRLMASEEHMDLEEVIDTDEEYLREVREIIDRNHLNVIFVSNEVGTSPIESNRLGRYFQDLQGRWNRIVADFADEVFMLRAGIPQQIKKKNVFPFKVGAPSYVLPTGYIENVVYLMGKVDDVQLLAFDSMADDPLFKKDMLQTLAYLARDAGLTYSLHMSVRPKLFDAFDRRLENTVMVMENLTDVGMSSYTFHFDLPDGVKIEDLSKKELIKIQDRYIVFFNDLKEKFPGADISLENTETPLSLLDRIVLRCGLSYCIDIGHLIYQEWDLDEIESRLSKTSVIHLHGSEVIDGKNRDHRSVVYDRKIFRLLESFTGIVTIENYHKFLLEKSLDLLNQYF